MSIRKQFNSMAVQGAIVSVRKNIPGHDAIAKTPSIPSPNSSRSRASTGGSIPVPGFTRIPSPVSVKKGQRAYEPAASKDGYDEGAECHRRGITWQEKLRGVLLCSS